MILSISDDILNCRGNLINTWIKILSFFIILLFVGIDGNSE